MPDTIDTNLNGEDKTTLVSRNITVMGKRTSVRLEPEMWQALKEIAKREKCTIHDICTLIKMRKAPLTSLTAAIRVFLMLYFRASSTEEGHSRAKHGNFASMALRARVQNEDQAYFSSRVRHATNDLVASSSRYQQSQARRDYNGYKGAAS